MGRDVLGLYWDNVRKHLPALGRLDEEQRDAVDAIAKAEEYQGWLDGYDAAIQRSRFVRWILLILMFISVLLPLFFGLESRLVQGLLMMSSSMYACRVQGGC